MKVSPVNFITDKTPPTFIGHVSRYFFSAIAMKFYEIDLKMYNNK